MKYNTTRKSRINQMLDPKNREMICHFCDFKCNHQNSANIQKCYTSNHNGILIVNSRKREDVITSLVHEFNISKNAKISHFNLRCNNHFQSGKLFAKSRIFVNDSWKMKIFLVTYIPKTTLLSSNDLLELTADCSYETVTYFLQKGVIHSIEPIHN